MATFLPQYKDTDGTIKDLKLDYSCIINVPDFALNTALNNKLNKDTSKTTYDQLYAKTKDGASLMANLTSENVAISMPIRNLAGTFKISDPTDDQHPVTKKYLETQISSISYSIVTTTADGLVPKLTTGTTRMSTSSTERVLVSVAGAEPVWKLLPSNAYLNTNTNYYPGKLYESGLQISAAYGSESCKLYVPYGTDSQYGVVKPYAVRTSTYSVSAGGTTTGRYYGVESDSDGKLFVNVPWTNTIYTLPKASSSALGGIKTGYTTSDKNYKVQVDSSGNAYVNVPWTSGAAKATLIDSFYSNGNPAFSMSKVNQWWASTAFQNSNKRFVIIVNSNGVFLIDLYKIYFGNGYYCSNLCGNGHMVTSYCYYFEVTTGEDDDGDTTADVYYRRTYNNGWTNQAQTHYVYAF